MVSLFDLYACLRSTLHRLDTVHFSQEGWTVNQTNTARVALWSGKSLRDQRPLSRLGVGLVAG